MTVGAPSQLSEKVLGPAVFTSQRIKPSCGNTATTQSPTRRFSAIRCSTKLVRHQGLCFLFNENGGLILERLSRKGYEEICRSQRRLQPFGVHKQVRLRTQRQRGRLRVAGRRLMMARRTAEAGINRVWREATSGSTQCVFCPPRHDSCRPKPGCRLPSARCCRTLHHWIQS